METIEGLVEDLSHDGSGVVKVDGKVYFVNGALPGETVSFEPRKKRRGKFEGILHSVIQPSEDRVTPRCEYFGVCGGCSFQHLSTQAQLRNKEKTLFDNLQRLGNVVAEERIPAAQSALWLYRRKARPGIRFVPKKGGILIGFRERNSSYITSLQHCHTLDERLSDLLPSLHELVTGLSNHHRIPQIECAGADNAVALVLRHLESLSVQDTEQIINYAKKRDLHFYSQSGGLDTVKPLWPENPKALHYRLDEYNLTMEFGPVDFIQVNAEVNQLMIRQAVTLLEPQPGDQILDLFCGLGNFTLPMATTGAEVVGVEGDRALVQKGEHNARLNDLDNARFEQADLHEEDLSDMLVGRNFDKVLLDPPRSGALEVVKQLIPRLNPERVLYVSCNPATLARDAGIMVNVNGYRLVRAGAIDMFPHTAHVESIALFVKD